MCFKDDDPPPPPEAPKPKPVAPIPDETSPVLEERKKRSRAWRIGRGGRSSTILTGLLGTDKSRDDTTTLG